MPVGTAIGAAVVGGGAKVLSAKKQAKAARRAGELRGRVAERGVGIIGGGVEAQLAELRAAEEASIAEQRRQFDIGIGFGEPRREAETAALNELRNVLGLDGDRDFTAFEGGPGFQFARDEALQAVERSAAARGGLVSGGTLAALQSRASGLASQNFLQTFLNPLTQLAGGQAGLQAAQQQQALGRGIGQTLTGGATQRASALAGGATQQANILAGAAPGQALAIQQQGAAKAAGIEGVSESVLGLFQDLIVGGGLGGGGGSKGFGGGFAAPVNAFRG